MLERIRVLHADHDGVRLMRRAGLQGVPQRRQWRKRPSGTRPRGTRNHLNRDFTATAPNTKGVPDITSLRTAEHCCTCASCWIGIQGLWSAGR